MTDAFEKTLALLAAAKGGDREALAAVLALHGERIRRLVRARMDARVRARAETDDLIGEVVLDVLRGFDRFEIRESKSFERWIAEIVRTTVLDALRKRIPDPLSDASDAAPQAAVTSPFDRAARAEDRRRVLEAMARLTEDHRTVVELRDFKRLPYAEVARVMGRAEAAVQMLHRRAMLRLTQFLADDAGF